MEFIKKRLFLILCVSVVVLGGAILAWGMVINSANKKKAADLQAQYDGVARLRGKLVHDNELAQWKSQAQRAQEDVKGVKKRALDTTRRELIYDKVFPRPRDTVNQITYYEEFAVRYCAQVKKLLRMIKAADRPSQMEEQREREKYYQTPTGGDSAKTTAKKMTASPIPGVMEMNIAQPARRGTTATDSPADKLVEDLRRRRAEELSVYIDLDAFCAYKYWKNKPSASLDEMLKNSWFSQLASWIQEDVVLSIQQVNDSSRSVLQNPIKRLIEISFMGDITVNPVGSAGDRVGSGAMLRGGALGVALRNNSENTLPGYVMAGSGSARGASNPAMGFGDSSASIKSSWTGRSCDGLADVVHFEVAVIVDSTHIVAFTNAMQSKKGIGTPNERNQITVLNLEIEPVDVLAEEKAGYYYGPSSLVVLRIDCEYVFIKSGYEKFMPIPVKASFQTEDKGRSTSDNIYGN